MLIFVQDDEAYFHTLGLTVNVYGGLACISCKMVFNAHDIPAHLRNQHSATYKGFLATEFNQRVSNSEYLPYGLPEPPVDKEGTDIWNDLALEDGYGCNHCDHTRRTEVSIIQHHKETHSGQPRSYTPWKVQRFNNLPGPQKAWFRVKSENVEVDISDDRVLQQAVDKVIAQVVVPSGPPEARAVSAWLLSNRWHEFTADLKPSDVAAWIAPPAKNEFPGLSSVLTEYMEKCVGLIKVTDEITLQRLNTEDPAKG